MENNNKQSSPPNVVVYTTPTCAYCVTLKAFLEEHKISYLEKDVTDPRVQQELLQKCQCSSVPVIDINGQIIVGFSRDKISQALNIKE